MTPADPLAGFLEATVRQATPLAYAALGELLVERSGVINIGVEGAIIAGAFASLVAAGLGGAPLGYAGGAVAGALAGVVLATFVVVLRTDQIIAGTAVSMLGLGLTGTLYRTLYGSGGAGLQSSTSGPVELPLLSRLPLVGRALFDQPIATYALYALFPAVAWWLYRTAGGLALRAVGENPVAAQSSGVSPARVRWWAIVSGAALAGVGGATLVLAQVGTFAEGMSAGRGFIAIAIVALGRWRPGGVARGAILFGGASALGYLVQAMGWPIPYQASLALPYVLTLLGLIGMRARGAAPQALGVPLGGLAGG